MRNFFPIRQFREPERAGLLRDQTGSSLLEMALLLPMMLLIAFNAVNIGYDFSVYLNLATAPRQGAEYSIQGTTSVLETTVPSAGSVSSLVYDNITGAVPSAANTPTRVCTMALGLTASGASQVPNCAIYGTGTATFSALQADPEAPYLVLNRVDIQYTVTPLIPGLAFNLFPSLLTLQGTTMMRAMP
jgi:Flp pilus assembly protein TadG